MVLTDELQYAHSHQVLHVSFSHNGRMFATCSKDGFVHVGFTIDISTLGFQIAVFRQSINFITFRYGTRRIRRQSNTLTT